jgi:hypothetical protein
MHINDFVTRFGVQTDVHLLLTYTQRREPDESGRTQRANRSRWSVVCECPDQSPGDKRVLVVDYETGPDVDEEDLDALEALAYVIVDSREGAFTFEQYVDEYGAIPRPDQGGNSTIHASQHPIRLYAQWVHAVWLYHQVNDWCSSPEMKAALADVRLSD